MDHKTPPKIEKLEPQTVPLKRLGATTLGQPIPEDRKRLHAAKIARALAASRRERGSRSA